MHPQRAERARGCPARRACRSRHRAGHHAGSPSGAPGHHVNGDHHEVPPIAATGTAAEQAPRAARQAAPSAAKAATIVTWVYAACFGLPAIPVAVYLLRNGRLPWLFDAFPIYGGPWYHSGQPERFAAQLGAFLVLMLVVSSGGWLLWRGRRAGAVLALATIPVEALFWYGFALPIPPLLALARVALVIAAWPRLRR